MVRRLVIFMVLSAALAARPDVWSRRYQKWVDAPLGIAVTQCDYSARGVFVRFETDVEPPYVVGVYRPSEEGLGRRYPIAEVETSSKSALVPGNFTDVTLFVQVMSKAVVDKYVSDDVGHRVLTGAEWRNYVDVVTRAEPYVNTNASVTFETDVGNRMELVEDFTWAAFVKTDLERLSFSLRGHVAEPNIASVETNVVQDVVFTNVMTTFSSDRSVESIVTNAGAYVSTKLDMAERHVVYTNGNAWGGFSVQSVSDYPRHNDHESVSTNYSSGYHMVQHDYSVSVPGGRADLGTGYRIMLFEDTGVCQAQRAYSARTNMSDAVVLPRGFRALSSHDGYIYTTDWEGRRYFQRVTNRVDHVFSN